MVRCENDSAQADDSLAGFGSAPKGETSDSSTVRVVHGANEGTFPIAGHTVGAVALRLRIVFNIPPSAIGLVNGHRVSSSHVLAEGDNLEFLKPSGRKGGVHEYWSEDEVAQIFGAKAVDEMRKRGIEPSFEQVFTWEQVAEWQASRRSEPVAHEGGNAHSRELLIDPETFTVSHGTTEPCFLGNTLQFQLLHRLARRPGRFVHYDILKTEVWRDEHASDETIARAVRRLREQLRRHGLDDLVLKTQKHHVALMVS